MKKIWLWKILLGTALVLIPGSTLLLPFVVVALQRQRAGRQIEVVQKLALDPLDAPKTEV